MASAAASTLLCVALLLWQASAQAVAYTLHGILHGDENALRIDVHGRSGQVLRNAAVAADGRFTLTDLEDGRYSLHVVGSRRWVYPAVLLETKQGNVHAELRIDPLVMPGALAQEFDVNQTYPLALKPTGEAKYLLPKKEGSGFNVMRLLQNKMLLFQLFAVAFIVLFPRYLNTLDKETLAEFTGEVQEVEVDANAAIKALIGANVADVPVVDGITPASGSGK